MLSSNGVLPELKVYRIELVAPSHRSAKSLFSFGGRLLCTLHSHGDKACSLSGISTHLDSL